MANSGPILGEAALARRQIDELEQTPLAQVRRWARGEATLHEVKGYTSEELFCVAQQGYTLFLNGKVQDAQVIFEGLVALDPRNDYYYRALGVIYHRRGAVDKALRQFSHAIKVNPRSPAAFVNRAEVHISRRDYRLALDDLDRASTLGEAQDPVVRKARALRSLLRKRPY